MIRDFLIGGLLGLGLWLVLRGLFPPRPTLADRLTRFAETTGRPVKQTALRSTWGRFAVWVLRSVKGDDLDELDADLAVTDTALEAHAVDKLHAGVGGGVLLVVVSWMFGIVGGGFVALLILAVGSVGFYLVPDGDLRRKAAVRRDEFSESLNAFVNLVTISVSGGSGINNAMSDVVGIGRGWAFDALRQSMVEAELHGESPWAGFDRLGRRLQVTPLIELAGALSLAGNSGARVIETLQARAVSGQQRELADAMASAEKKSESMNVPVAAMILGWVGFMGYPAVIGLLGV